jgi:ATP/maltotriose-dependent transcriptional regulator MalT/DNA-binding SARP family transcriptional activator
LQENEHHRIILILGQAAQGKSTLAASFAQSSPGENFWISIFPEDDDPVNLFYAIISALSPFLEERDVELLLSYPAHSFGPREQSALYRDWSRALFDQFNSPIRITFDGLDRLPDESEAFHFLRVMLEAAPEKVKFLLISRRKPPFPLHDWQIKQRAFFLHNQDLAFTYQETRAFLRHNCGLHCKAEQVKKVWHSTEGWVGGLVILSQVLKSSESPDSELTRIEGLPDRFQAEVFLYFAQEIFAHLSEENARILLCSSVFQEVSPQFLDTFMDMKGSAKLLQELASRNLFVHSFYDAARGWIYSYHQLFREFLQSTWRERYSAAERKHFLLLAARASARKNYLESAVDLFLRAEEPFLAASVLAAPGRAMMQAGRNRDLTQTLQRFPERVIQAKPWLLLFRACCRRYSHAAENIPDFQKAEGLFRRTGNIRGMMLALGYLMEAVMLLGRDPVSIHSLLARGEDLLSGMDFSELPRDQAFLWLQMGFAQSLRGEDTRKGYRASQNALMLARKIQDRPLQIQALINSIIPLTFLGELSLANRLKDQVEGMLQKTNYPELEALFLKMWSELVLFGGRLDLELAARLVEQLQERIEQLGLLYVHAPALYSEFAYHMYAGDAEKAEQIGNRLLEFSDATDNSYGRGFCSILLGLLAYRQRQWSRARDLLETGLEIFRQPATLSSLHDHQFSIGAGLVHMHLTNWQQAESLLKRSLQHFTSISSQLARTEALLSLALLYEKKGSREKALEHLESGLSIASARQYTHFVILSPQDQISLCFLALHAGSKEAKDYAVHLLQTALSETVAVEEPWLVKHPHKQVQKVVYEVLRSRHRSNRPCVYIQSLGRFRVWVGGQLLSDSDWEGNQAQNLLRALVALASEKPVRKELVIEELWPESSPGAGEKTFKVALHRLRRTLEPDMDSRFGSSYLLLKHGALSLDSELCCTDIQDFQMLCRKARNHLQSGETQKALQFLQESDSLYQGDFLPDEAEKDWAREVRERLRRTCIEAQFEAARAYESLGSRTKAIRHYQRALECDPLLEEAYRRIMRLYADRGKRAKALQVYEQCRMNLHNALDVKPEELTMSLYRKIKG